MAIDNRFSKEMFDAERLHDAGDRGLSDLLQTEVRQALQDVVVREFFQIIERLNGMGHQLKEYYPPEDGDIAYRDDRETEGTYECDLRLSVDLVISAGYRDTKDWDDIVSEDGLDES